MTRAALAAPYQREHQRPVAPTLVIDGGASWGFLRSAAAALVAALPNGQRRTLADQTHDINPDATTVALTEFLAS